MKFIQIDRGVISGQCHNALVRVQIFYTAYFLGVGLLKKGWQGLQFGIFSPEHNSNTGYKCVGFYAELLPAISGPVVGWPKWYIWIHKQMITHRTLSWLT